MDIDHMNKKARAITRLISILLALAFLAGALPQPVLAATCGKTYTVKSGDTLSGIALLYKLTVAELAAANNLTEPYTIYIGQVLCIPVASTTSSSTSSSGKASFSLALDGRFLVITTSNFPKRNLYYVRVSTGRFRQGPVISTVGRLMVRNKPGNVYIYKLPKELTDASYLMVCLKNAVTDANTCRSLYTGR